MTTNNRPEQAEAPTEDCAELNEYGIDDAWPECDERCEGEEIQNILEERGRTRKMANDQEEPQPTRETGAHDMEELPETPEELNDLVDAAVAAGPALDRKECVPDSGKWHQCVFSE